MRSYVQVANGFSSEVERIRQGAALVVGKTTLDLEAAIKDNITAVDAIDTGTMLNTTTGIHEPGSLDGIVTTDATDEHDRTYWQDVNYGTHKMAARPFVEPSVDSVQPAFDAAMAEVVSGG